jgi:competence protein ComEC
VLSIVWVEQSILLTGDIGKQVEWQLFEQIKTPYTVLLAPHHGSRSSASHRFILATKPEHVVFSAGYKNSYGHPAGDIVDRYQAMTHAQIWDTGRHGAITFQWRGSDLVSAYGERLRHRRYWYDSVYPDAVR